jgi:hypothetical protein
MPEGREEVAPWFHVYVASSQGALEHGAFFGFGNDAFDASVPTDERPLRSIELTRRGVRMLYGKGKELVTRAAVEKVFGPAREVRVFYRGLPFERHFYAFRLAGLEVSEALNDDYRLRLLAPSRPDADAPQDAGARDRR